MRKTLLVVFLASVLLLSAFSLTACNKPVEAEKPSVEGEYGTASTDDVKAALAGDTLVLDARIGSAFNGWVVAPNKIGGHIEGASDFAANWLTAEYDDKNNIEALTRAEYLDEALKRKGITPESKVILYDENGSDAKAVADFLASKGVKDISLYDLAEWDGNIVSYPNFNLWVPATAIKDLIEGKQVAELPGLSDPIILDVRWGEVNESGYLDGHIPTALPVNSDTFDDPDRAYILRSDAEEFEVAKNLGITKDSFVIVTGDPIFSTRYASIIKYLGVDNTYVMSGGLSAWTDAGFELETAENKPNPVSDFGLSSPGNPDLIDSVEEVEELLKDPNFVLVDNRREIEYKGEDSGYSYFEHAGRIEGAVYGYAGIDNSSSMLYYRNVDGTMRNGEEIFELWESAGIDRTKHLSFMCGGGYRAGEVLWDAHVLGLENASVFSDGWCGWALAGKPSIKD